MNITHKISLVIYLVVISFYEFNFFYNNFSGIDQVRHLAWIHFLRDATHLLPSDFFDNHKTIFYDHYGFFYELFRYAYKDIGHILNIVPILITYLLSFFIGLNPNLLSIVSIIFSNLSIYICFLISVKFFKYNNKINNLLTLILFVFIFSVNNIFLYSSLGIHNVSLFFFLAAIYYFIKNDNFYNFKINLILCFLISIACYSHKINALLLPAGIIFYFLLNKQDNKNKIKELLFSIINLFIFLSPIMILFFLTNTTIKDNIYYAQINFDFLQKLSNLKNWMIIHYQNVGIFNFLIFCFAIPYLYITKKNSLVFKIFSILFIHFILSIFADGFISYHIRTTLYSTFIILLINFIFVFQFFSKNSRLFYILVFMLAINFSIQLNSINNLESIKNNRADYYNFYFKNINHKNYNSISEILKKIDRTTEGHKIIFDSNLSEDIYYVYSKNKLRKIKFDKLRPIKNLIYYQKNNELEDFLKKTNFKKIKPNEVFLISVDYSNSNVIDNFTILEKSKIFENQCKLIYKPIFSENVFISGEKKIFLHKVSCSLI